MNVFQLSCIILGQMERFGFGRFRPLRENIDKQTYLARLRSLYPISQIYYPGCWNDHSLEETFDPKEIIYLDSDFRGIKPRKKLVVAKMEVPPFIEGIFDAMFYQDVDVEPPAFKAALRTVRLGGLVIFSSDDCGGGIQIDDVYRLPELSIIDLPFKSTYLTTFERIA